MCGWEIVGLHDQLRIEWNNVMKRTINHDIDSRQVYFVWGFDVVATDPATNPPTRRYIYMTMYSNIVHRLYSYNMRDRYYGTAAAHESSSVVS